MSRRAQKNVGVIGLGIIGRRVADCLRRRGFHVFVWNRTPRPFPNFVGSAAELAELCDFIQIFVSNDEALLETVRAMKPALKAHHIVLAHSTVAPETVREAAEIVQRRGGQLLDAPFTGSKGAAEKGELVYYIGGDEAAYRRVRPVLDASSQEIIEIGEVGQAMTIKLATNMITAATVQSAAEALALVDRSGISLEKFETAMRSNGSNSGTLAMKLPKMLGRDFETQFSVKHMLKDVEIASQLARRYGLRLEATDAARAGLREIVDGGGADDDYSAVIRNFFPDSPAAAPEAEKENPAIEPDEKKPEPAKEPTKTEPAKETPPAQTEPEPEEKPFSKQEVSESDEEADRPKSVEAKAEAAKEEPNDAEIGEPETELESKPAEPDENEDSSVKDRDAKKMNLELLLKERDAWLGSPVKPLEIEDRDEPEPDADDLDPEARETEPADNAAEEKPELMFAQEKDDAPDAETAKKEPAGQTEAAQPRGFFSRIFSRSGEY